MDQEEARRVACDWIHGVPQVMDIYMKQDELRKRYSDHPTPEHAYDARFGVWVPEPPPEFMALEMEWDRIFEAKVRQAMYGGWAGEIRA